MSNVPGRNNVYSAGNVDILNKIYQYIKQHDVEWGPRIDQYITLINNSINNVSFDVDKGAGPVQPNTTRVVLEDQLRTVMLFANWNLIPGNVIEYVYYTGVVSGNPSGSPNLRQIIYKQGSTTLLTTTFTYDSSDRVLTNSSV